MAVIVNNKMPIELALRLLWRESNREGIPDKLRDLRFYVSPSEKKHEKVAQIKKRWRRSRSAARRYRSKHNY